MPVLILCLVAIVASIYGLFLLNCPFSFSNVYVVEFTFPSLNANFIQLLPIDEVNNVFVEPMKINRQMVKSGIDMRSWVDKNIH